MGLPGCRYGQLRVSRNQKQHGIQLNRFKAWPATHSYKCSLTHSADHIAIAICAGNTASTPPNITIIVVALQQNSQPISDHLDIAAAPAAHHLFLHYDSCLGPCRTIQHINSTSCNPRRSPGHLCVRVRLVPEPGEEVLVCTYCIRVAEHDASSSSVY